MILIFDILIGLAYILFTIVIYIGWKRGKAITNDDVDTIPILSVIIPVRNEADNILALLKDLQNQTYNSFEVIIIDDDSDDETREIVSKFMGTSKLKIQLSSMSLDKTVAHKKAAIEKGIKLSQGEVIVTTDGDCRVGPEWLSTIANCFKRDTIHFVSGPVCYYQKGGVFKELQIVEFSSLVGVGAATLNLKMPTMCNGANLAFRKQTYYEVGGYSSNSKINSGDDEFLMHDIYKKYPNGVRFQKSKKAIVKTSSNPNWKAFKQQRIRWASKWKYYQLKYSKWLSIMVFLLNIVLVGLAILSMFFGAILYVGIGLLSIKLVCDYFLLATFLRFFDKNLRADLFLLTELFHIFYVLYFGVHAQNSRYTWKGRKL